MHQVLKREPAALTPETALWALWAASGMAEKWTGTALGGGALGARADHDL